VKQHLWIGLLSMATLAGATLTGGCATKAPPPATPTFVPVAVNNFARTWTVALGIDKSAKATDVYVFDNLIIVYADDATSHVVNRQSGQLMFIHPLPTHSGTLHAPAIVGDKIIYPATSSIKIYSVKSGKIINDFNVPFALRSSGTGNGNNFYIGADYPNGGRLEALDLNRIDGLPRWEAYTNATIRSTPILYQGIVFVASQDGKVRALSEERGSVWSLEDYHDGAFQTAGAITGEIRVDETAVYVASTDSKLYALNRSNGKIKWQYISGVPLHSSPMTSNDTAYIYVDGQGLTAINKLEGAYNRKPRWIKSNATMFLADDDKYSYVLLDSNQVAAIEKTTGVQKFVSTRNDLTAFGVNTKDGLVYATDPKGNLLQIKPVVKQGVVGELVLDVRPLEVASR